MVPQPPKSQYQQMQSSKRWQCPWAKLWCVPLVDNIHNENTDTLLLDHPCKHDCFNSLYEEESTTKTREHINTIMLQTISWEYIHSVYSLLSIEPTIRYLHATPGFPVEEMWLKAIQRGNFNSWSLINNMNVSYYFPESEGQGQGACSRKKKPLNVLPDTPALPPHESKSDIYICIYELKKAMYYNQAWCFPKVSSLRNKYIMVIHNVDSNSSWAETLKDNTGGKLILAQAQALEQMQKAGIVL
jgi:hypothetical protein